MVDRQIKRSVEQIQYYLNQTLSIWDGSRSGSIEEAITAARLAGERVFVLKEFIDAIEQEELKNSESEEKTLPYQPQEWVVVYTKLADAVSQSQSEAGNDGFKYCTIGEVAIAGLDVISDRVTVTERGTLVFDAHPQTGLSVFIKGLWLESLVEASGSLVNDKSF